MYKCMLRALSPHRLIGPEEKEAPGEIGIIMVVLVRGLVGCWLLLSTVDLST